MVASVGDQWCQVIHHVAVVDPRHNIHLHHYLHQLQQGSLLHNTLECTRKRNHPNVAYNIYECKQQTTV